jgi:hypothetical protein
VRRAAHHSKPLSFRSCHSNELSAFAPNAIVRRSHHVRTMVNRVNRVGLIETGGSKVPPKARPW